MKNAMLIAPLLVLITIWAIIVARRRKVAQPQCGRCGYPVKGLPTFICPECGGDLREWGIRTQAMASPREWRWLRLPMLLFVWTMILNSVGSMILSELRHRAILEQWEIQTRVLEQGSHARLERLVVTREWRTSPGKRAFGKLHLSLGPATGETIEVDWPAGAEKIVVHVGERAFVQDLDELSEDHVSTWYSALGVPLESESDRKVASTLATSIRMQAIHPERDFVGSALSDWFGSQAQNTDTHSALNSRAIPATYTVLTAVWILGIVAILLWWRRKRSSSG